MDDFTGDFILKNTIYGNEYKFYPSLPYLGEGRQESMDMYIPTQSKLSPTPAVLIVHGGGWASGSKGGAGETEFAEYFTSLGYTAVSIDYALNEYCGRKFESRIKKMAWPLNVYDCKTAVRFIRKYASRFCIDPGKLSIIGHSAGGHLALLAGLEIPGLEIGGLYTEQVNGVNSIILFNGIADVDIWGKELLFGDAFNENPWLLQLASGSNFITQTSPKILVIHGDEDDIINIENSFDFIKILKSKNISHAFVKLEGGKHLLSLENKNLDIRKILKSFLDESFEFQKGHS